jgi:predicted type IV restriction endonuclease
MLREDIEGIREAIKVGRFMNEAAVCQGIILRVLQALSWPTYDTQDVGSYWEQSTNQSVSSPLVSRIYLVPDAGEIGRRRALLPPESFVEA